MKSSHAPCSHPTHLTVHLPYSLSQPYDGKFSGFPMLTARSVISISGLDNTGSPDSWHIHYKNAIWCNHTLGAEIPWGISVRKTDWWKLKGWQTIVRRNTGRKKGMFLFLARFLKRHTLPVKWDMKKWREGYGFHWGIPGWKKRTFFKGARWHKFRWFC